MNRKFVKENKKTIREFLGNAIVNIIGRVASNRINRMIDNDPKLRKTRDDYIKLGKQIDDRLKKLKQKNPEEYDKFIKKIKL